ncbi:MAG: sigma 54-interacting transcriptional regulator [Planctomycetes bacterium]|nr:sigma 54-interacting transcriptional regulator [Planctomycetota bacterium]
MVSRDDELAALRAIVEGTAAETGTAFFESLVRHLASAVDTQFAFVAEFDGGTHARTLAFWFAGRIADNISWDLRGTPCERVIAGDLCHYPSGVAREFPEDRPLVEWGIESYLGIPLRNREGLTLGHLAAFDNRPMPAERRRLSIFQIFAARAAAELERLRIDKMLRESEERYRDLYDEAPIAYVQEDLESRFIGANRAAMRILGIPPEQVPGTVGMSFIPDTPEAQRRVREAFASVGRGTDTSGVVLELRRKDDGRPIWIQWWSKPDRSGKFTRTMFVDITDRVLAEQERARLQAQNLYLQEEIKSVHNFDEIVGRSPALLAVLEKVNRVAPTDASVLITGETGTGKELVARAIHSASQRRDKPLIKLNCAALPTSLVESELFGHEKGAFSGAIAKRVGRFELAHGGTIFLDEIGEVPIDVQAKLLRVLQEREFERVGGNTPIRADVRVIAATNRNLEQAVASRSFREDLYYRLNVFPLHVPPVRERREDIPLLTQFLIGRYAARVGKTIEGVSRSTMERFMAYPWPGNVREMENLLERAVILATEPTLEIDPGSAPAPPGAAAAARGAPRLSLEDIEREHILSVLKQTNWVIDGPRGAAGLLNLHPNTLRSRLKKLGIARPSHDSS